jgi:Tfp pilus assembly protein PilN
VYYVRAQAFNVLKLGVVLLAIMAAFMYYQNLQLDKGVNAAKTELQNVQAEQNKWKPNADKFEAVKSEISTKKPKFGQIYSLVKSQFMWPAIMEEVGNRIPDTCFIDEIEFQASTNEIKMKGTAVDRIDIMQFAISLDNSDFFTQTTAKETVEDMSGGGGGGGPGGGGGGGSTGMGLTADARNPYYPGIPPAENVQGGSILPQSGYSWDSRQGLANEKFRESMPLDFELPRLGIRAGRSIEDYFGRVTSITFNYKFTFDITTKLQDKALNQPKSVEGLSTLEEVTKDVLNT